MARTLHVDRIERTENTIARLLEIVSAVEVLAALYPDEQRRWAAILLEIETFKTAMIAERNTHQHGER